MTLLAFVPAPIFAVGQLVEFRADTPPSLRSPFPNVLGPFVVVSRLFDIRGNPLSLDLAVYQGPASRGIALTFPASVLGYLIPWKPGRKRSSFPTRQKAKSDD